MDATRSTLVARCTPCGAGALSLIRIAGSAARKIASLIGKTGSTTDLRTIPTHTVVYGSVNDSAGNIIDTVLFIVMDGPKTFTGDDTVEITCHNNDIIVEKILDAAIDAGARLAKPGEFTRRAIENGKIDLCQAEAIHELITAQNDWALKQAHAQLRGTLSQEIYLLEQEILTIIAWSEASFDFLDEGDGFSAEIDLRLSKVLAKIDQLRLFETQKNSLRSGIRIAIIGVVNAGKSSLFNALLGTNRAIVSPHPGTTRDTIEAEFIESGNRWILIDTAGIRFTDDQIEQAGIERSYEEAARADIIILAEPLDRSLNLDEQKIYKTLSANYSDKVVHVLTKHDSDENSTHASAQSLISLSSRTGHNIALLHKQLCVKAYELINSSKAPFLLTNRHIRALQSVQKDLLAAQKIVQEQAQYELISLHLQQALEELSGMSGKSISEAAMDRVFKEFCVGK